MLCAPAHRGNLAIGLEQIPAWATEDVLGYVLHAPVLFVAAGEAEAYHAHLLKWAQTIVQRTVTAPERAADDGVCASLRDAG